MLTERRGREFKLKIFFAEIVDQKGKPGQVLCADNRGLIVAAGDKALLLHKVQLEGKWRMSGYDFIRGHARLLESRFK